MSDNRKYPRAASLRRCEIVAPTLDAPLAARVINQSPYGLLLELDYPLPVSDELIQVYLADEIRGTIDRETQEALMGMVRWCKQEAGSWSGSFQAGVEIITLKPRRDVV